MTVLCKLPPSQDQQPSIEENKPKPVPEVRDSSSTQTEIIAVHTPQVENLPFPFANKLPRPSTLMLIETNESAASGQRIAEVEAAENNLNESTHESVPPQNGRGDAESSTDSTRPDAVTELD